jgi:nitrogen fixation protein FixH
MTTVQINPAQSKQEVTLDGPGNEGFSMVYNPRAENDYVATLELAPGTWYVTQRYTIEVPDPEEETA